MLDLLREMRADTDKRYGVLQTDVQQLLQDHRDLADRVAQLERGGGASTQSSQAAPQVASQPSFHEDSKGEPFAKRARSVATPRRAQVSAARPVCEPPAGRGRRPVVERSIVLSGFARAKSLAEYQELLSLLFADDCKVFTSALFAKVAFVQFATEDSREAYLQQSRSGNLKLKVAEEEVYVKPMLSSKAVRVGYELRSAQRLLVRLLETDKKDIAICYRSGTICLQREIACFFRDDRFHRGVAWPAQVDWQALLTVWVTTLTQEDMA